MPTLKSLQLASISKVRSQTHGVITEAGAGDSAAPPQVPELAAQAIRAGLVDEFQMIVCPVVGGGGKRFFPDGVRLDLELLEERRSVSGVVILRYGVRGGGLLVGLHWA